MLSGVANPRGRKVILAWDKAGIDFNWWYKVKQSSGLYFISREKENMKLIRSGNRPFDREDHRNAGVVSDESVGPGGGGGRPARAMLRRITYLDPIEGTTYVYLTTEMTLPPGILVLIYKQRWDVEKTFDELKSKLVEKKAWGNSPTAKSTQALFLCLTHNLMVLLEEDIRRVGADRQCARAQTQSPAEGDGGEKRRELYRHRAPALHREDLEIHSLVAELRLPRDFVGGGGGPATACLRGFLKRSFLHR